MPRTIAEADWKVLRRIHPLALERYCERVLAEIDRVTHNNAQSTHQRYLEIFKIIEQRDREISSIFNDLKRYFRTSGSPPIVAMTDRVMMCGSAAIFDARGVQISSHVGEAGDYVVERAFVER